MLSDKGCHCNSHSELSLQGCLSGSDRMSKMILRKEKGNTTHRLLESPIRKVAHYLVLTGLRIKVGATVVLCLSGSLSRTCYSFFLVYRKHSPIKKKSCPGIPNMTSYSCPQETHPCDHQAKMRLTIRAGVEK